MAEKTLEQTLQTLREEYAENLPATLTRLQELWGSLQAQWQVEHLDELYARVHKIAGSAGSFGFATLSRTARELEVFLQALQARSSPANAAEYSNISSHLQAIERAAQHPDNESAMENQPTPQAPPLSGKLLYLVDDDTELANYLALQIRHAGFEVKIFNQIDFLPDAVRQRLPDALLMDIMLAEDDLAGPRIIYNLQKHRQQPLPVIFMSARVDMKARLAAVRAGGHAYFTKPININLLIDKLIELVQSQESENLRVLIVDEDGEYAEGFSEMLHAENIQLKTLLKPMQLPQALDKFAPMLVLMNQHLSGVSGVELAQIIHQQEKYAHLPVILFSEEFGAALETAYRQGIAQDYINTQVEGNYLAALVRHRIQRARSYQKRLNRQQQHQATLAEISTSAASSNRDRLTGLYKRKYLLDQIEIASKHHNNEQQPPCLLYIKLDNYRDLDQAMGLTATESLVVEAAHFLQSQAQSEEVLSRLNDDTFVLLTLNRSFNNVRALAELIRTTLENHVTEADDGEQILSTCTVGISLCEKQHAKHPAKILQNAENACLQGQSIGSNQVKLHDYAQAEKHQQQHQSYWRQSIELALKYNSFFLVYQPITHLHGDSQALYDVLLRMQNPDKNSPSSILPERFLPTAQASGQLQDIDRWVIKHAIIKLMREHQQQRCVTFIVRISAASVENEAMPQWLAGSLRLATFPRQQLIFDIPKTVVQEQLKKTQAFIKKMRELGCRFALSHLDEQGTSTQLIRLLSPEFIKLDNGLIQALSNKKPQAVENIQSLTEEMHAQKKQVIAPFVENMYCLNQLWQCGIDYIAGHFVEAPEKDLNYDFSKNED